MGEARRAHLSGGVKVRVGWQTVSSVSDTSASLLADYFTYSDRRALIIDNQGLLICSSNGCLITNLNGIRPLYVGDSNHNHSR